jgi:hypothetical protein
LSVTGSIALAACERVEKSGGPRAGLVAWRALATNAADTETRAKALMGGLRCTIQLRDGTAAEEIVAMWVSIGPADQAGNRGPYEIDALCRDLMRAKMTAQALDLAEAEATRDRNAHSLYLYARCLDVVRDARAIEWLGYTIDRAERDGAAKIVDAARLRRVALLASSWTTLPDALVSAEKLAPARLSVAGQIELARIQLFSGSRFVRAGAIGLLAEATKAEDVNVRLKARRLAARYADEAGAEVTPLEHDRLVALFDHDAKAAVRGSIVAELDPIVERGRDILRGRFEVPREATPMIPSDPKKRRLVRHGEVLDVVVAMRDKKPALAARALRPLVSAKDRLPREAVFVACQALVCGDDELREVATQFFARWLARPSYVVPPRGFLALADALGDNEMAMIARRAATHRKEKGAIDQLGVLLTRVGWEAARDPDRLHAIRLLREAKALMLKG